METLYYTRYESPVGPMLMGVSETALVMMEFSRTELPVSGVYLEVEWEQSRAKAEPYIREVEEYFAGTRKEFSLKIDLRGTEFQMKCWRALLAIPFGETRSYADIAREIGSPKAVRAVGSANHDNPIAIVVPCHRVVGTSGKLTGYAGGLDTKKKLLELEGAWTGSLGL